MRFEIKENDYGYEILDNADGFSLHSDDDCVGKLNELDAEVKLLKKLLKNEKEK